MNAGWTVICALAAGQLLSATAAWAVLATLPVTWFRIWLFRSSMGTDPSATTMVLRALLRMALSLVVVLVGSILGLHVLLGVFIGLVSELLAYVTVGARTGRSA